MKSCSARLLRLNKRTTTSLQTQICVAIFISLINGERSDFLAESSIQLRLENSPSVIVKRAMELESAARAPKPKPTELRRKACLQLIGVPSRETTLMS